jgi:Mn-dependent DtxR family transcriptional regulator
MAQHMRWSPTHSEQVARYVTRNGLAQRADGTGLVLTDKGRQVAQQVMLR